MPEQPPRTNRVEFQPAGRRVEMPAGETLLEAARQAGVDLAAVCGGMGVCRGCRVRLVSGALSPLTLDEAAALLDEEIRAGYRLACQAAPAGVGGEIRLEVPGESLTSPQRLQLEGQAADFPLDPPIRVVDVDLARPSLADLQADDERLRAGVGLRSLALPHPVLETLSDDVRLANWNVRLLIRRGPGDGELAAVWPRLAGSTASPLGLAVDVGTTKLAAYLVDLQDGQILARQGSMNPLIVYGEDVISRIQYANQHADGLRVQQARLVEAVQGLLDGLCAEAKARPAQVVEAVMVGNTAMHHLLVGLPVRQLGVSPYVPAVSSALYLAASELGLRIAAGGRVYLPPNVAGYVGADHVAMLLGAGLGEPLPAGRRVVALDIGTNTEISLVVGERILACSTASGPAFEGAHIQHGMRAAAGAIERVKISGGQVYVHTIGGAPAVGICGSGILDAVAELLLAGALDPRGNLRRTHPLVQAGGNGREVVLAPAEQAGSGRPVTITRKDINEIQLAKGAIRTGIEALLGAAAIGADEVDEWIIAGAFGSYLNVDSALAIGMFPPVSAQRFRQVGNAAGAGARRLLLSNQARQLASHLARRIEYLELTTLPDFADRFTQAIML